MSIENQEKTTKIIPVGRAMLLINKTPASTEAQGSGANEWVMSCQMGDNI